MVSRPPSLRTTALHRPIPSRLHTHCVCTPIPLCSTPTFTWSRHPHLLHTHRHPPSITLQTFPSTPSHLVIHISLPPLYPPTSSSCLLLQIPPLHPPHPYIVHPPVFFTPFHVVHTHLSLLFLFLASPPYPPAPHISHSLLLPRSPTCLTHTYLLHTHLLTIHLLCILPSPFHPAPHSPSSTFSTVPHPLPHPHSRPHSHAHPSGFSSPKFLTISTRSSRHPPIHPSTSSTLTQPHIHTYPTSPH